MTEPRRENVVETVLAFVFWPIAVFRWVESHTDPTVAWLVTIFVSVPLYLVLVVAILAGLRL
jgi:hypothetical protein